MNQIGNKYKSSIPPNPFSKEPKDKMVPLDKLKIKKKKERILTAIENVTQRNVLPQVQPFENTILSLGNQNNKNAMENALFAELNQVLNSEEDKRIDEVFIENFIDWIRGIEPRGMSEEEKKVVAKKTWWWWVKRKDPKRRGKPDFDTYYHHFNSEYLLDPIKLHGEDFVAYLRLMVEKKHEFWKQMTVLRSFIPQDLPTAWLYWKYVINNLDVLESDYIQVLPDDFMPKPNLPKGPPPGSNLLPPPPTFQNPPPSPPHSPPTSPRNQPPPPPPPPPPTDQQQVQLTLSTPTFPDPDQTQPALKPGATIPDPPTLTPTQDNSSPPPPPPSPPVATRIKAPPPEKPKASRVKVTPHLQAHFPFQSTWNPPATVKKEVADLVEKVKEKVKLEPGTLDVKQLLDQLNKTISGELGKRTKIEDSLLRNKVFEDEVEDVENRQELVDPVILSTDPDILKQNRKSITDLFESIQMYEWEHETAKELTNEISQKKVGGLKLMQEKLRKGISAIPMAKLTQEEQDELKERLENDYQETTKELEESTKHLETLKEFKATKIAEVIKTLREKAPEIADLIKDARRGAELVRKEIFDKFREEKKESESESRLANFKNGLIPVQELINDQFDLQNFLEYVKLTETDKELSWLSVFSDKMRSKVEKRLGPEQKMPSLRKLKLREVFKRGKAVSDSRNLVNSIVNESQAHTSAQELFGIEAEKREEKDLQLVTQSLSSALVKVEKEIKESPAEKIKKGRRFIGQVYESIGNQQETMKQMAGLVKDIVSPPVGFTAGMTFGLIKSVIGSTFDALNLGHQKLEDVRNWMGERQQKQVLSLMSKTQAESGDQGELNKAVTRTFRNWGGEVWKEPHSNKTWLRDPTKVGWLFSTTEDWRALAGGDKSEIESRMKKGTIKIMGNKTLNRTFKLERKYKVKEDQLNDQPEEEEHRTQPKLDEDPDVTVYRPPGLEQHFLEKLLSNIGGGIGTGLRTLGTVTGKVASGAIEGVASGGEQIGQTLLNNAPAIGRTAGNVGAALLQGSSNAIFSLGNEILPPAMEGVQRLLTSSSSSSSSYEPTPEQQLALQNWRTRSQPTHLALGAPPTSSPRATPPSTPPTLSLREPGLRETLEKENKKVNEDVELYSKMGENTIPQIKKRLENFTEERRKVEQESKNLYQEQFRLMDIDKGHPELSRLRERSGELSEKSKELFDKELTISKFLMTNLENMRMTLAKANPEGFDRIYNQTREDINSLQDTEEAPEKKKFRRIRLFQNMEKLEKMAMQYSSTASPRQKR